MRMYKCLIFLLAVVTADISGDRLKCYTCLDWENCDDRTDWTITDCPPIDQPDDEHPQCLIEYYQCGETVSDDCQAEYDNAVRNKNIEAFYRRCATEEGATPLRTRCALCCREDRLYNIYRGCAIPKERDQNACHTLGFKKCVCDTDLCNEYDCECTNTTTTSTPTQGTTSSSHITTTFSSKLPCYTCLNFASCTMSDSYPDLNIIFCPPASQPFEEHPQCLTEFYSCGKNVSDDCQSEHDNAVRNNNI